MYSMILLMAMSGSAADTPSWGLRGGCCGGGGCAGASCGGYGHGGCHGGGHGWGHAWRGGCCGGFGLSVHGGGSCEGSGFGRQYARYPEYGPVNYYGFAGCYGSCYGSYTNYFSYWSMQPMVHYGYGMPRPAGPVPPTPVKPTVPKSGGTPKIGLDGAPASVLVCLPAEATLLANGKPTTQTSDTRSFVTPNLPAGQAFHYVLTAQIERDGRMLTQSKEVEVAAGLTTKVEFDFGDSTKVATK